MHLNNKVGNILIGKNIYRVWEGSKINLLFICSQNKRRSLTAEKIFQNLEGHSVRSAGTETNSRVKVTPGMVGWADMVFCMEKKHVRRIKERYGDIVLGKEVVCLNIKDEYEFMEEELICILESCVYEHLSLYLDTV